MSDQIVLDGVLTYKNETENLHIAVYCTRLSFKENIKLFENALKRMVLVMKNKYEKETIIDK